MFYYPLNSGVPAMPLTFELGWFWFAMVGLLFVCAGALALPVLVQRCRCLRWVPVTRGSRFPRRQPA